MKPLHFAAVATIRARHDEDVRSNDFQGRALLAHEDRAELLAIVEQLSRRMREAAESAEQAAGGKK